MFFGKAWTHSSARPLKTSVRSVTASPSDAGFLVVLQHEPVDPADPPNLEVVEAHHGSARDADPPAGRDRRLAEAREEGGIGERPDRHHDEVLAGAEHGLAVGPHRPDRGGLDHEVDVGRPTNASNES